MPKSESLTHRSAMKQQKAETIQLKSKRQNSIRAKKYKTKQHKSKKSRTAKGQKSQNGHKAQTNIFPQLLMIKQ